MRFATSSGIPFLSKASLLAFAFLLDAFDAVDSMGVSIGPLSMMRDVRLQDNAN